MSFRTTLALRSLLRHNVTNSAFRPSIPTSPLLNKQKFRGSNLSQSHMKRFYTTPTEIKQSSSKISDMVSSPEIIQAAKVEPKVSKVKELSKKYGAVGILVYLGVGVVDLGITLGVIQFAGLEKVKALEEGALEIVHSTGERFGFYTREATDKVEPLKKEDDPSFASVFILAYGIHKTILLPVRLGITAAITPAVVRKIHQLGWARYFPKLLGAASATK